MSCYQVSARPVASAATAGPTSSSRPVRQPLATEKLRCRRRQPTRAYEIESTSNRIPFPLLRCLAPLRELIVPLRPGGVLVVRFHCRRPRHREYRRLARTSDSHIVFLFSPNRLDLHEVAPRS